MTTLEQVAADLAHAAGGGGAALGVHVTAEARTGAEIGAAVRTPGPGLRQASRRRGASTQAETRMDLEPIADRMAAELADGGVALAMGKAR